MKEVIYRRRKNVKGAVLLMVLSVMSVLIIMLAGAMTIVSTASNRAYTKFEENQAYYTARSGVELVTQTLMGDSVHIDKNNSNDGNNEKSKNNFKTTTGAKSQALALEEAITGVLKPDSSDPTKMIYDVSKSLTAWDTINNPTGAGLSADQKKKSYMIFNVNNLSNFGDGESGMFTDAADGSTQIKIQLLKLVYDNGTPAGVERNSIGAAGKVDVTAGDAEIYYITKLWVMVECTATYNGTTSTVSKVVVPIDVDKKSTTGFTSLGGLDMYTNASVFGGATSATSYTWRNDGTTTGDTFVNGNGDINAQKRFVLKPAESMVINGNLNIGNNTKFVPANGAASEDGRTHPYLFVNGTLSFSSNLAQFGYASTSRTVGADWQKFDVITQNLELPGNYNGNSIYGDTYVDGYLKVPNDLMQNLSSTTNPLFAGNLFISDRTEITLNGTSVAYVNESGNIDTSIPWEPKKTELNAVTYGTYTSGEPNYEINRYRIKTTVNTGSKLWQWILTNGGDSFCSGDIYYYYEEYQPGNKTRTSTLTGNTRYAGCIELEAIRQYICDIKTANTTEYQSNMLNLEKFLNKLHPITPVEENGTAYSDMPITQEDISKCDNLKYIIQLSCAASGTPAFADKMTLSSSDGANYAVKPSNAEGDSQTYMLRITLPYVNTDGTVSRAKDDKAILLPTLLSKYAEYFFVNNVNPLTGAKWVAGADDNVFLDASGSEEKTNFKYWDSLNKAVVTKNWKTELADIAGDLVEINDPDYTGNTVHGDLLTRAWDIFNAIYEVDAAGAATAVKNVNFIPPALAAYIDNNILFQMSDSIMNFSSVANIDVAANLPKTFQTLTPSDASGTTTTIDTSSNDVIVMMQPGTYQDGEVVVAGNNYAYFMMPFAGGGEYKIWNFSFVTNQFMTDCITAAAVKVGGDNGAAVPANAAKIKSPNMYFYADDGTTFNLYNGGSILMGYIFGPGSKITANSSSGLRKPLWYEGVLAENYSGGASSVSLDILGSVFVGDIDVQNDFGFIYIPQESSKDDWEPKFNWQTGATGYSNNGIITENDVS